MYGRTRHLSLFFTALYAGGIEDWVDGHLGIDHTYTIMMFRTTDSYNTKLITERVVHEGFAAMDTLLLQSVTTPLSPPNTLKRANSSPKQLIMQRYIIIFFIALHYKYY
ncbi:unnamed protein product [Diatraea saccharalis]|uniref:Uncharacterized protein n=1 Tax=Diatraea saccharalis TaxID=40085 RepID=A0A9N9QYW2_9NEOP|nr:unnamed protein product [Diatraea saccharalis]